MNKKFSGNRRDHGFFFQPLTWILEGVRHVGKKDEQRLTDKIRHLESEIWMLREKLRAIAPIQFEEVLSPYGPLPKDFNPYRWHQKIAPTIIAGAVPLNDDPYRAPCPLCNGHPEQHDGYALPNGLERHLTGALGQRQCSVMEASHILIKEQCERERNKGKVST